jgi:hypothetical protein
MDVGAQAEHEARGGDRVPLDRPCNVVDAGDAFFRDHVGPPGNRSGRMTQRDDDARQRHEALDPLGLRDRAIRFHHDDETARVRHGLGGER